MEKVKFQVLGYKNVNRKSDGKAMTILNTISVCTAADNAKGIFGNKVTDFFMPDDKVGTLTEDCVGKQFVPNYELNDFGKPALESFEFLPWK